MKKILLFVLITFNTAGIFAQAPAITSFTPASGPVGTLVTVTGTNLDNPTAFTIGGVPAIVTSNTGTQLVGMIMPGAVSGNATITTAGGTASSISNFTVTTNAAPMAQQGSKFVGSGALGTALQGQSVAVSADGNTAIVAGEEDNSNVGAVWLYERSGNTWTQQGNKLVGTGANGAAFQGTSVAISADGNTAVVGGSKDNSNIGAIWIFTRSGFVWAQQGLKLVGTGTIGAANLGGSVSISADGNTVMAGGLTDNTNIGAAWVFVRANNLWTQQGAKLVGSGSVGQSFEGGTVALSADGSTAIIGGSNDNNVQGAAWVFTRSSNVWTQQGNKLVGTGSVGQPYQGGSVSLSADGNIALVGSSNDNSGVGAAWVYTRSGGAWTQQGGKLVSNDYVGRAHQGWAVALNADGSKAIITGYSDNLDQGAAWVYTRNGSTWTQQGPKLIGAGAVGTAWEGWSAALSADGNTALIGGRTDNANTGAAWAFNATTTPAPVITAISPANGAVGTMVTVTGSNLSNSTAFTIGGVPAIVISNTNTKLVGMVMPGAVTGKAAITTAGGTISSTGNFTVAATSYPIGQLGPKLVGTGNSGASNQGNAVAVSADGNTAIVGGFDDNSNLGAAWIYTRSGNTWTQQGAKLVGTGAVGAANEGVSVAISADGNTAIIGGYGDNSGAGAAWIFTRSGSTWTQQGAKLVGTGAVGNANQGGSVSISADGNTALVGGYFDNSSLGAAWVYTRTGGIWTQQGTKLVGSGAVGPAQMGASVSLSADGNTAIIGAFSDNSGQGAAWIYTRNGVTWTQQGAKLVGTGAVGAANQGQAVALSADGNTAMVGGLLDNSALGAAWIYTRSSGSWTQQGAKLVGTGAIAAAKQGRTLSLSADGNTALIGGFANNYNAGATWVFTRAAGTWTQRGTNLIGSDAVGAAWQGFSASLSADGSLAIIGGRSDNSDIGAAWVFSATPTPAPTITSISPASGAIGTLVTITGNNLDDPAAFTIGGVPAIIVSGTSTQIVGLVMPGASTGIAKITTPGGTISSSANFTVTATPYPVAQQGAKLTGSGTIGYAQLGKSVAVSADGNTAVVGAFYDYYGQGATYIYTRTGGVWAQQGSKLIGTGGDYNANQGRSVAISADGNTIIVGGSNDNGGNTGSAWIFTRNGNTWTQQGAKLTGTGAVGNAAQGTSVSLSADGNTAIVGGPGDNSNHGAVWIFTRAGTTWTQVGSKLVGTGAVGAAAQGGAVYLSADGKTAMVGGISDNSLLGAAWIFTLNSGTWTQQGAKLVGTGSVITITGNVGQGSSVALSADGNTAIMGGSADNSANGAAWIFARSGNTWTQQGGKLVGTGAYQAAGQGNSVSLTADGNTAVVGGAYDYGGRGAFWVYTRNGSTWIQQGAKLTGTGAAGIAYQGNAVSLSADGSTLISGGNYDNNIGAIWVFSSTPAPAITSIAPSLGPVGTLVTINGTSLGSPTSFTIGGVPAILVSATSTKLVGMVMPGATTSEVSVNTSTGTINSSNNFTVTETPYPSIQQGVKLIGTGAVGNASQGYSAAVSADGNTAIVGGYNDNSGTGAAWIYTRSGTTWAQRGAKIIGTGAIGAAAQGSSVAISADGYTVLVGGSADNAGAGAVWVFVRNGATWTQQGSKLMGTGAVGAAKQGISVSLSADGNTAVMGGSNDNSNIGAIWIFARSGVNWSQQSAKLVGNGSVGQSWQGVSVSLSADGNTVMAGGNTDNTFVGAAWVYTRINGSWSQQGAKLVGTGGVGNTYQGGAVSLSADGNTAVVGGSNDNAGVGGTWVYTRNGTTWTQQGAKLIGTGAIGAAHQGSSLSLSADGNTALISGYTDNTNGGAAWTFIRSNGVWVQKGGKLGGTGATGAASQGSSVSISADGTTALIGGPADNSNAGAAWAFINGPTPAPAITSISPASGSIGTIVTITGTNLESPLGFTIGGVNAITISSTSTTLVGMVAPGAITGAAVISTPGGTANSAGNFTVKPALYPTAQQGPKLVGSGAYAAQQGWTVAISSDGSTAMVGGVYDNNLTGAAWTYTKTNGVWSQMGTKLTSPQAQYGAQYGFALGMSADGNTAIVGERFYNGNTGTAWVYTRVGGAWSPTPVQLKPNDAVADAEFGYNISLSADGNTAIISGANDNNEMGASWIFTRIGGTWKQQGPKLVANDNVGVAYQGYAVGISMDGNTAIVGGTMDNGNQGAVWIYTRSAGAWTQQGPKLIGTGSVGAAQQGRSVSLSADGNTAIFGGFYDNNNQGAAWIFKRSGVTWTQQGPKLVGTDGTTYGQQGIATTLSADGNAAIVGGVYDNSGVGAAWLYTRNSGVWAQKGAKMVGTGAISASMQGYFVAISADANSAIIGAPGDNFNTGAAWAFAQASTDATLSALSATAAPSNPIAINPNFAPVTKTYTATSTAASITITPVTNNVFATVTVNGTTVPSGSPSGTITLNVGNNVIKVKVTAQDGTATQTYTLTVTKPANSVATLSALSISSGALSPTFASATTGYTALVGSGTTNIMLTPATTDPLATLKVNGTTVTSGSQSGAIALAFGDNIIKTVVTAPDGTTTQTYTLTVTRAANNNATLNTLALSAGTLSPAFSSAITSYTASVGNAITNVKLTPASADANATVTVNGTIVNSGSASANIPLNVGDNVITIVVTAQDGTTTQTYTVTINRAVSTVATLSNLSLSSGTLSPDFSPASYSYATSVNNTTTSITLTPAVTDATATIKINGTAVSSGAASGAITLNVGSNTIVTVVTAQDGVSTQTYTVTINRAASSVATLSSLSLSSGTLSPAFAPATLGYTASVGNTTTNVTITPATTDPTAIVSVNGTAVTSGSASGAIALNVGSNVITTVVTAQDGVSTQTYTVTLNRAPSSVATLNSLVLSDGTLSPAFASTTNSYTASVVTTTSAITEMPVVTDGTATIKVNGLAVNSGAATDAIALNVGDNVITTVVTAQDGTTTQTYTVNINRAPPLASITSISPATGALNSTVTINGIYFTGATAVNFGGVPAASFNVVSPTTITAVVGSGASGDVTVTTTYNTATLGGFNFVPAPTIAVAGSTTFATDGNGVVLTASPGTGFNYQWMLGGVNISGANSVSYTATQGGLYTVSISLNNITQVSAPVTLNAVFALPANNFSISTNSATCHGSANGSINITALQNLNYTASVTGNGINNSYPFTTNTTINNLTAGTYNVCLTVIGQNYQQCFTSVIEEPKDLALYTSVDKAAGSVTLTLRGSDSYNITLNGVTTTTSNNTLTLKLGKGDNDLIVSSDKSCQGIIERHLVVSDVDMPFPNPFTSTVNLNLGDTVLSLAVIDVYNANGLKVYTHQFSGQSGFIQIDLSALTPGIYVLRLTSNNSVKSFRIVKI